MGYRRKIVSFEPLTPAFRKLASNARTFPEWTVVQLALGDVEQSREINVAGNSQSSSFLEMLPAHVSAQPKSAYVGKESFVVRTLDSVYEKYCQPENKVFLKIDVQGFEEAVLRGASRSLPKCAGVQLELSVVPLYDGSAMLCEMMKRMNDLGFSLMDIFPSFADPGTGKLLQVDGTFFRR
jgi:FkbM family methyltransferase